MKATLKSINLRKASKVLELVYSDITCSLSCEFLRVHSPSAEVQGHGEGQETLQTGKMHVNIKAIEPVGNYGLKLVFDDGHDTGIYTWEYLHHLCLNQGELWQQYLDLIAREGASRDPNEGVVRIIG